MPILILAILALASPLADRPATPRRSEDIVHKGRTLGEWIELIKSSDQKVRREAIWALEALGPKAVQAIPTILGILKANELDVDDQVAIAYALREIGSAVKDSLPALVEALAHPEDRVIEQLAHAIEKSGRDGSEALVGALKHKNPLIRARAAHRLGHYTPKARHAVPALAAALNDEVAAVRLRAAVSLGFLKAESQRAVPVLVEALKHDDDVIRRGAAWALGLYKADAASATASLGAALKDRDEHVRSNALSALIHIGPAAVHTLSRTLHDPDEIARREATLAFVRSEALARAAVPALVDALKSPDADVRFYAARALRPIGSDGKPAVPGLTAMLKETDENNRSEAADALGAIGPAALAAESDLLALLRDESTNVRLTATEALWRITGSTQLGLPVLLEILRTGEDGDACASATLLGRMGPQATGAIPLLREKLKSDSRFVAVPSATALWQITADAEESLPRLIQRIEARPDEAGMEIRALRDMGPAAKRAAPILRRFISGELSELSVEAAEALWRVTGSTRETLPHLEKAIANDPTRVPTFEEERIRERAFEIFERLGPEAAPLLPQILRVYSQDEYLATLLGRMGPAAKEAVPLLIEMLDDPYHRREEAAAEALKRVDPVEAAKRGIK